MTLFMFTMMFHNAHTQISLSQKKYFHPEYVSKECKVAKETDFFTTPNSV